MAELPKERTAQWRDDKRRAGYRPVTLWLPADVKGELDALAYHRHQDIAQCLADAIRALAVSQGRATTIRLDSRQLAALKAEIRTDARPDIRTEVLTTLAELGITVPVPPETPEPFPPLGPPPPGMKFCGKHHAYPVAKKECPQCVRERKRRFRQAQAQKRAGTVPLP